MTDPKREEEPGRSGSGVKREVRPVVEQIARLPSDWRLRATMAALLASDVLVAGCSGMTQPEDIAVAEELCAKRGGFTHVARSERGKQLTINCKDGTFMDVRPGGRA